MQRWELIRNGKCALEVRRAVGTAERRRGLLGRDAAPSWGLLLERCPLVHTIGMRFAIDGVFLDRHRRVVKVAEGVKPGRPLVGSWRARSCLELRAGLAAELGIGVGDRLQLRPQADQG